MNSNPTIKESFHSLELKSFFLSSILTVIEMEIQYEDRQMMFENFKTTLIIVVSVLNNMNEFN